MPRHEQQRLAEQSGDERVNEVRRRNHRELGEVTAQLPLVDIGRNPDARKLGAEKHDPQPECGPESGGARFNRRMTAPEHARGWRSADKMRGGFVDWVIQACGDGLTGSKFSDFTQM